MPWARIQRAGAEQPNQRSGERIVQLSPTIAVRTAPVSTRCASARVDTSGCP